MPSKPRPRGFVPPHLLKEISKSKVCSPESQQAAAETLKHDESRAVTSKSSQDQQDGRYRGTSPSTDGDSGKSDDGMDGRWSGDAPGTATAAGGEGAFKTTADKSKHIDHE